MRKDRTETSLNFLTFDEVSVRSLRISLTMARRFALCVLALVAPATAFVHVPAVARVARPMQSTVGGWEKDYYSTVNVEPAQLDAAFLAANGAAIEAKLAEVGPGVFCDRSSNLSGIHLRDERVSREGERAAVQLEANCIEVSPSSSLFSAVKRTSTPRTGRQGRGHAGRQGEGGARRRRHQRARAPANGPQGPRGQARAAQGEVRR